MDKTESLGVEQGMMMTVCRSSMFRIGIMEINIILKERKQAENQGEN